MEEQKKCEVLKLMLEQLQKAIQMYNELNPEEKLTITPQDERKDVSEIFVCVYNDNCVGLFKKIDWSSVGFDEEYYNAGSIYVGVDSSYIGIKLTHYHKIIWHEWQLVGYRVALKDRTYEANCYMTNGMSFDDMRLKMYCDGQIGPYEIGKASSQEMIDVLKYAVSYYQLDQNKPNQRGR